MKTNSQIIFFSNLDTFYIRAQTKIGTPTVPIITPNSNKNAHNDWLTMKQRTFLNYMVVILQHLNVI